MAETQVPDAQWPVIFDQKCELCEINNIMFKCLNCDEMVCDTCKKSHLNSKATKHHKMVDLKSAEIYENNLIGNKCSSHKKEEILMYCNICNCPICRECISSGVHLNHPLVKVEEVIDTKHNYLSDIIRQTNEKCARYKDTINIITQNQLEFSESITNKIKKVKARNKQLKIRLDKMESDLIQELQNIDKEHKKAMSELEQRLQEEMSDLKQLLQQCERKRRERNIEMVKFVTDITQRLDKFRPCEPPVKVSPPDLITRHVDDEDVKSLFGHIDIWSKVNPSLPLKKNLPSAIYIKDVVTVGSFTSNKNRIVTTSNDQAWLWRFLDRGISLVTSDGKVIQDINADFEVFDAAVSTSGDLFVTTWKKTIKKFTRHNTFTDLYKAADGYMTEGITVTDTGNVLVMLSNYKNKDSKMMEITTSGQHIRTIQCNALYDSLCICTNINGDIIVRDGSNVAAVNQQGQKRFIYQGEGRQLQNSFNPYYIVTDKHGHIIISDHSNSVIHVLDKDGKFLQYLITPEHGCDGPVGLALDNHCRLWMCNTWKNEITIMKYS